MTRVVLDTNIIVSATILEKGHSAQVLDLWREGEIEVAVSPQILEEIEEVLKRPRIVRQQWMANQDPKALIRRLRETGIVTPGEMGLKVVEEDPDDDKFIVCALEAGAGYIVSGDPHLTNLGEYQGVKVVSPREFLKLV